MSILQGLNSLAEQTDQFPEHTYQPHSSGKKHKRYIHLLKFMQVSSCTLGYVTDRRNSSTEPCAADVSEIIPGAPAIVWPQSLLSALRFPSFPWDAQWNPIPPKPCDPLTMFVFFLPMSQVSVKSVKIKSLMRLKAYLLFFF